MIKIVGDYINVDTRTMVAVVKDGWIVSMKSKDTGDEYMRGPGNDAQGSAAGGNDSTTGGGASGSGGASGGSAAAGSALELVYAKNETIPVSSGPMASCETFRIDDYSVELRYHNWDADGILLLREDRETGDLLIEPSAYASRPGVRSVRYNVKGLRNDLSMVVPLYQGTKTDFSNPAITGRRAAWPMTWEAGFFIAEGARGGVWAHVRDAEYRFKTLTVGAPGDPYGFGLESDNYGPIEDQRSAGGLVWRFNVFTGDWRAPAASYRDWLWKAFSLEKEEALRPQWLDKLSLALSWCPTDVKLLEAIAEKVDPHKVLLHLNNWRKFGYDEDYPYFAASEEGRAFAAKCKEMGFRVMPHCSSMEIDPSLPEFQYFDDFAIRDLETGRRLGWSWVNGAASLGVPGSDIALRTHKANKVMIKIHTAFPMWHSVLRERIREAVDGLDLESVFIDVTLCLYNPQRSLVNNTPTTKGFLNEIRHLQAIGRGVRPLYIGGEGLNEINARGISFAQVHLFERNDSAVQLTTGKCDLNRFLFGKLMRSFGYSNLNGKDADSEIFMQSHLDHGTIPTLTVRSADEITSPNKAVAKMLKLANEL